MTKFNAHFYST